MSSDNSKVKIKYDNWTKEQFIENILKPIQSGRSIVGVASDLSLCRARIYHILKQFGFNNRQEVLEDVKYK